LPRRQTGATPIPFFFQAEDGIRDFHVTGVQTCALPISLPWPLTTRVPDQAMQKRSPSGASTATGSTLLSTGRDSPVSAASSMRKIGRASCREGAHSSGVGASYRQRPTEHGSGYGRGDSE